MTADLDIGSTITVFFLDSKIKGSLGLSVMNRWLVDLQNEFHLNINGSWNKENKRLLEENIYSCPGQVAQLIRVSSQYTKDVGS